MFKNLLQFWKGKDFISEVMGSFKTMLDDSEKMFKSSYDALLYEKIDPELENEILKTDKRVNTLQKEIRTRIIEHMTVQPSVDTPASLLLFSVSKDAERVGDYAKNLLEVSGLLDKPVNKELFLGIFDNLDQEILDLFQHTKDAFIGSDEEKAARTWELQIKIKRKCDKIVRNLAKSEHSVNEAVCFTLVARFIRRMSSHLTNIATSALVPLSELDYYHDMEDKELI